MAYEIACRGNRVIRQLVGDWLVVGWWSVEGRQPTVAMDAYRCRCYMHSM
jgi:hypothetical protein